MELTYGEYSIVPVYGRVTDALRGEIVEFWTRNRAIGNPREAWRRTGEVVYVVRRPDGAVAGVSTVYVAPGQDGRRRYVYRMFIQPGDRVYGMMAFVTAATRDLLRELDVPNKPAGVVIVTENRKIMRKGMRRVLRKIGFTLVGKTQAGLDVWRSDFATPPPSPRSGGTPQND
jgi:hypothetical protein